MRLVLRLVMAAIAVFILQAESQAQPPEILLDFNYDSCYEALGISYHYVTTKTTGLTMTTDLGDGSSVTRPVNSAQGWDRVRHIYMLPGTYTVRHVLKHNGNPVDSISKNVSIKFCGAFKFGIYNDLNGNCTREVSEHYIPYGSYRMEIDSGGVKKDTAIVYNAWITVPVVLGQTYTFKLLDKPPGSTTVCGPITAMASPYQSIEFGVPCSPTAFDLHLLNPTSRFRPINHSFISFLAGNFSCAPKNAVVTVSFSPKYAYDGAYPTPASVSGNTITWNLSNLFYQFIYVGLKPATTISLGDTACYAVTITPTSGDINTTNNAITICDSVIASYDPNSKEAFPPEGPISPSTRIQYTINFENLGNDTAFDIFILDTLSDLVIPGTFEMLSASHAASPTLVNIASGKTVVRFNLSDIKLADKSQPLHNKGFVKYAITAKANWPAGAKLENRAGIYFDINPVVMTNTTVHTKWTVGVDDISHSKQLQVYPNPTSDVFMIKADPAHYNTAKVVNSLGQVVRWGNINNEETSFSMKALANGIYYILVSGPQGTVAEKIEKR